eukprot:1183002-Prorocentrum_minimum.AAC.1
MRDGILLYRIARDLGAGRAGSYALTTPPSSAIPVSAIVHNIFDTRLSTIFNKRTKVLNNLVGGNQHPRFELDWRLPTYEADIGYSKLACSEVRGKCREHITDRGAPDWQVRRCAYLHRVHPFGPSTLSDLSLGISPPLYSVPSTGLGDVDRLNETGEEYINMGLRSQLLPWVVCEVVSLATPACELYPLNTQNEFFRDIRGNINTVCRKLHNVWPVATFVRPGSGCEVHPRIIRLGPKRGLQSIHPYNKYHYKSTLIINQIVGTVFPH